MARTLRTIDRSTARRLAITVQRLAGTPPRSSPKAVLGVIRSIRCVQLDPIAVVARSPLLVLGSRVAGFDPKHLDRLLWRDHSVYEYWAHAASIVLTEDHPIHAWYMRQYLRDDGSAWNRRRLDWMAANAKLKRSVLAQVRRDGPMLARRISGGLTGESWRSSGWTNERNVDRMLGFLWASGRVMVAGREGIEKRWDLTERVLPADAPRERLSDLEVTRRAVDRSLRGLGVGTPKHIRSHFTRDRYPELNRVLAEFERTGRIERVVVEHDGAPMPGTWYVHRRRHAAARTDRARPVGAEGHDAVAVRQPDRRPRTRGAVVRPLLPDGDLRPEGQTALRLLLDAGARRRPVRRTRRPRDGPGEPAAAHPGRARRTRRPDHPRVRTSRRGAVRDLASWLGATEIELDGSVPAAWRSGLG